MHVIREGDILAHHRYEVTLVARRNKEALLNMLTKDIILVQFIDTAPATCPETVFKEKHGVWEPMPELMISSQVVRASGCQCQSRNSPGLNPSIRHSGI
jgi:hypothetical protein